MVPTMIRAEFIPQRHLERGGRNGLRAILVSCAFHGLLLGSVLGLGFLYRSHLPLPQSGSAPGASVISLETMVITSPPAPPMPPKPAPVPPMPALADVAPPQPPSEPLATVPVLAAPLTKLAPAPQVKTQVAVHPAINHSVIAKTQSSPKPAASTSVSSYAPGVSELPHPPYPREAQDRQETGVVVMNVQFDDRGNVAHAEVAQSSGVPILDSETRSYIRAHWHSTAYAGQTISQPVEYSLQNL
jgi:periplasmic protein TonB